MDFNKKTSIIDLLCTSEKDNIELAELLCQSQSVDILGIIKEFGYNEWAYTNPNDFIQNRPNASCHNIRHKMFVMPKNTPRRFDFFDCVIEDVSWIPENVESLNFIRGWREDDLKKMSKNVKYLSLRMVNSLPTTYPNNLITLNLKDISNQFTLTNLPNSLRKLSIDNCNINKFEKLANDILIIDFINCKMDGSVSKMNEYMKNIIKKHNNITGGKVTFIHQ